MTLHLIRDRTPPPGVVGERDLVLYDRDGGWAFDDRAATISDDHLVSLIVTAERVAVW